MLASVIFVVLLQAILGRSEFTEFKSDFALDQDMTESRDHVKLLRPLTVDDILDLRSPSDVHPPLDKSYYKPYRERVVVLAEFPVNIPIFPQVSLQYGVENGNESESYGPPPEEYGVPQPQPQTEYGTPSQELLKNDGVIVTDSCAFTENVRDFANHSKILQGRKGSHEIVGEMAKAYSTLMLEQEIFGPDPAPSFAIIHLETRIKATNSTIRYGFLERRGLYNGTLLIPEITNPSFIHTIPFHLRAGQNMRTVLETLQGIPAEHHLAIESLLKVAAGLHEEAHEGMRRRVIRLRKISERLERPRFFDTAQLTADPLADVEAEARSISWLYTNTIAVRDMTTLPVAKVLL